MSLFLQRELTHSKKGFLRGRPFPIERRFVPVAPGDAYEKLKRLRLLLLRGAMILASANEGGQRG